MHPSGKEVLATAAGAGLLGLALGASRAELQHAVESAQVLAGIVHYPPESPLGVYHLRLWTILNQLLALGLRSGLSERALSVAVSAGVGMLSFQALALCTLASGRDRWLALASPAWIYFLGLYDLPVCYPVLLLGYPYTFGMVGTSYGLLALSLLGLGCRRTALFLLGLAPAMHVSIGGWCLAIGVASLLCEGRESPVRRPRDAAFLALGLWVSAGSLLLQLWLTRGLPGAGAGEGEALVRAFVRYWDGHRFPIRAGHPVLVLTLELVALATLWLRNRRLWDALGRERRILLRALAFSAALGVALALSTRWIDRLPLWLVAAMPGRYLNLTSVALAPWLLGCLVGDGRSALATLLLLAAALAGAVLALPGVQPPSPVLVLQIGLLAWAARTVATLAPRLAPPAPAGLVAGGRPLALTLLAAPPLARGGFDPPLLAGVVLAAVAVAVALDPPDRIATLPVRARTLRGAALVTLLLATVGSGVRVERRFGHAVDWASDWRDDELLRRVASGRGVLLTAAELERIQIRTRRPVLLDGPALDWILYAPEMAPRVARILRSVYGEDLRLPSREIQEIRPGGLLPWTARALWERRSPEAWRRLALEHGFDEVLAPAEWRLRLPLLATDGRLTLHGLSEEEGEAAP